MNAEIKEILLSNLARMGDLIQTTPVLTGLKKKWPDARITLLVNSAFKEICKNMPFIDRLVTCDCGVFTKMLRVEKHSLVECYRRIEELIDEVNRTEYDLAINVLTTDESTFLASLFNAREVRGVTAGADGVRIIRHPWQRYLVNIIPSRKYNTFHLCDMMIKAAGIPPTGDGLHLSVSDEESAKAKVLLEQFGVSEDDLLVGFHLGASQEVKTWPVASFARLGDMLAESLKARVLFTGLKSDEQFGKEFESVSASRAINLIGKTNLSETAALLKRCSLMITNDTGPLHIATAVGTTSIDLSLGHVCFRETGPYGENHYVMAADTSCSPCRHSFKCADLRCREMVTPNSVFELATRVLSSGRVEAIDDGQVWESVRVFRSFFASDGMQDYVPLLRRALTPETLYQYIYRETWPRVLDGDSGFSAEKVCAAIEAKVSAWHQRGDLAAVLRVIGDDYSTLRKMEALAGDALTRVSLIKDEASKLSPDAGWIQRIWEDVPVIDREIKKLGHTRSALMPPVVLFQFGREALAGKELAPMTEAAFVLYSDLKHHFSMLAETVGLLLEKHMKTARDS